MPGPFTAAQDLWILSSLAGPRRPQTTIDGLQQPPVASTNPRWPSATVTALIICPLPQSPVYRLDHPSADLINRLQPQANR
ncbi:hypothetical protein PGT21_017912 [Puccinia graminis f. sp. tritici]|uniref:Uncharacterized protein n=1 Tax=Puccinia graminis f. sp. tritici TaxID=56615 RepID=A0A5B0RAG1_PUCGR|nr:hypothetical protein PGT21_017912 [Puccinia graminis f. sp. tritici]KAA1121804.1 hypothetical protein PGTUg99_030649 [Puccinia graminis f. sp. tritici]